MYGMVQLGLEKLVTEQHGAQTWFAITQAAGESDLVSISNQSYPDELTFKLVGAACEVLDTEPDVLLKEFGRFWVSTFAPEHYATLLDSAGSTLPEFLRSLNGLHARAGLIFQGYRPPRFEVIDHQDQALTLRYSSDREGLAPFVMGLLEGLGERFSIDIVIDQVRAKGKDGQDDIFALSWR